MMGKLTDGQTDLRSEIFFWIKTQFKGGYHTSISVMIKLQMTDGRDIKNIYLDIRSDLKL